LIDDGYKTHGEVFTVPVLHKKITFLIGPDVAPHFYKATDFDMSQEEVMSRPEIPGLCKAAGVPALWSTPPQALRGCFKTPGGHGMVL
jgi:hypothetical protein